MSKFSGSKFYLLLKHIYLSSNFEKTVQGVTILKFKRFLAGFSIAFLMTLFTFSHYASAATYYMDNDPSSNYNGHTSIGSGSWSYRNYSGDYNGDSRTSSSEIREYNWYINGVSSGDYELYAWLADPKFTDRTVYYYIDNAWIRTFDQYSAPSGWNDIADDLHNGSTIHLSVESWNDTGGTTGADAVKVIKR